MDAYQKTILSQYANSLTIVELIQAFNAWIDPSVDIENFLNELWDIETCNDAGLDIWGKIVDIPRYLDISVTEPYFGFNEAYEAGADDTSTPFNDATFYAGAPASNRVKLATDTYRKLIMVKAMANISNCSIGSINALLSYLFPGGYRDGILLGTDKLPGYLAGSANTYCIDNQNMTMTIVAGSVLSDYEKAILTSPDIIPRPSGVSVSLVTP